MRERCADNDNISLTQIICLVITFFIHYTLKLLRAIIQVYLLNLVAAAKE